MDATTGEIHVIHSQYDLDSAAWNAAAAAAEAAAAAAAEAADQLADLLANMGADQLADLLANMGADQLADFFANMGDTERGAREVAAAVGRTIARERHLLTNMGDADNATAEPGAREGAAGVGRTIARERHRRGERPEPGAREEPPYPAHPAALMSILLVQTAVCKRDKANRLNLKI